MTALKEVNYSTLDRKEIVNNFKKLLDEKDIQEIIPVVDEITEAYQDRAEKRYQEEFKKFRKAGGYPADFVPPKDQLDSRFKELHNIYLDRERKFKQQKKQEEKKNLEEKLKLLEELKELNKNEDRIGKAFQQFQDINNRWKSTGKVPKNKTRKLNSDYHYQIELFYYNIKINKDLKELDLEKHLEQKKKLLKKIEALLKEKTIKKVEAAIKEYHDQWSDIGPVPYDQKEEIIGKFNEVNDQVFDKIRAHYKELRKKQEENLKVKKALCKKVEQLNEQTLETHKQWRAKTNQILKIQQEWKKAGRVPREESEKIWERFREANDIFFDRKSAFYEELKKDFEVNKKKKAELCEQAESMKGSTDWDETTVALIKLQKQWKKTGPAGRREEQILWKRFRAACDHFFEAKRRHYEQIEEGKKENLEEKEDLIKELERLELSGDAAKDLETLKDYTQQWNRMDEVPQKAEKGIQEKFSKVLNAHYDKIDMDDKERDLLKFKNKVVGLSQMERADKLLKDERKFLKGKISHLEDEVVQYENNLGFFANTGKANQLKNELEKNITKAKEDLTLWKRKMEILKPYMKAFTGKK